MRNYHRMSSKDSLKQWVSNEITAQLKELKQQINIELAEDLDILRRKISSEVTADVIDKLQMEIDRKVRIAVQRGVDGVKKSVDETVDKKLSGVNNQIAVANDKQLQIVKQTTRELVAVVGQQVTNTVYNKVIGEINEKIVPKVNNMVQYVNYQLQDGAEIVTDYRRAVETQANKNLQPGVKMLTDGKVDKRVISEHVRTFFSDNESDEDDD